MTHVPFLQVTCLFVPEICSKFSISRKKLTFASICVSAISHYGGLSSFPSTSGSRHALDVYLNPFSDLFDLCFPSQIALSFTPPDLTAAKCCHSQLFHLLFTPQQNPTQLQPPEGDSRPGNQWLTLSMFKLFWLRMGSALENPLK